MLTTMIALAISHPSLPVSIQHLQSPLDHVDVAAAVGQCFQHRLLIHRSGLGNADGSDTRSETFRHVEHIDPIAGL
jgi:hypothetical protein